MRLSGIRHMRSFKVIAVLQIVSFVFTSFILPVKAYAQSLVPLAMPGTLLERSEAFRPLLVRGFKVDPMNPLVFDFIVDKGDAGLQGKLLEGESKKLIKYFLTALTVPSKDLWVNLSPYENDRIIPEQFGRTQMGRDLLEQDYILKQLASSLMYPEADLGKEFWSRVYARAQQEFGTTDIPIDTFNKVWIIPGKSKVYEKDNNVYVVDARMKVMLEQDYVALENNKVDGISPVPGADPYGVSKFASDIVREVIVPEIAHEVNEGRNFAGLRQVHYALVLAAWYERKVRQTILGEIFAGKNKVAGHEADDPAATEKIYARYVEAFKKGAYNYIKEDIDVYTKEPVARKYFSGGYKGDKAQIVDNAEPGQLPSDQSTVAVRVDLLVSGPQAQQVADKTSDVDALITTKVGFNDKGLNADEQKNLDITKFDGLEDKGTVKSTAGEVKVLLIRDGMLGNLGYGFDRNNKAVVVSPQLIRAAREVLKDEQAVLDVVAAEYFDGEKAAYELGLQKLKPGVTKRSLFPYMGGTPEEMALNAEKEFDIPLEPVQADLEARAIEMDKDGRKIGPVKMPSVVAPDGVIKEDPVMVNKIGREIAIKAAYAIGLRILLGLLEVLPVEKLEQLSQLVREGKSLTMMFMPSKWAPPTQAHSAFVFKVSALMAGVQPAGKFGKQTLAILPNVTKKDNRKPIIFTTYDARNGITHKMLSGLLGDSAKVLESDPLYEDKNGEETVVEIVTRLLIDYLNAKGAKIEVPQVAGQINADLVKKIQANLPKGFLLRLLYQVGSDHYKTFSLSKAGFVNFGKITDGNREDQLYWARLNPLRYKKLIEDAGKMNDPALPDFNERKAFLDALGASEDGQILALIEKATYLPLLDTIGKYTMASSLYGDATDLVLVHTFRGADYMTDMGRDELIARHEVKVLNTDGFDAPVAATFVRQGLQELYLTGVFNYNKLGIVTRSVRSAILEDPQMIELLLRQDAEFNGDPKTFFPATPEIAMVAKSEQGTAKEEPIRKRKAALAVKHGIVGVQEAMTDHWETQLIFNGTELVYKIGILYHPDGTPKNVYTEVFALGHEGALDRMRAYARELNNVDAAGSTESAKPDIQGGIDFDLNNLDMDVTSDGPGVQLNFDPAMLNNGNYNGLVPVIRSVTPIADLPMFLGAQKAEPALAGAAT